MRLLSTRYIAGLSFILAITFIVLAIIGAIRTFSPVPFWDMWDGYLLFYTRLMDGDYSAWWTQHVDHRIIFSNVFFWIDLKFFNGGLKSLIAENYIMLALIVLCFILTARRLFRNVNDQCLIGCVLASICAILFSWIQRENLTLAFQGQMFAAILFPLASFLTLYFSIESERHSLTLFSVSCMLGITSACTMGNGLIALPILTLMAIHYRLGLRKIVALFSLSVIVAAVYLSAYKAPVGQGNFLNTLFNNPLGMLLYIFTYLGAPVHYIAHVSSPTPSMIVGLVITALASLFSLYVLQRKMETPRIVMVLLAVMIYVGATSFLTAGGRLIHGIDQALSSRYMTTVLAGWCAAGLVFVWWIIKRFPQSGVSVCCCVLLVPLALLPYQFHALDNADDVRFNKMLAALALELKIRDEKQIGYVFPWLDIGFVLAEKPIDRKLSIFSHPAIIGAHEQIGHHRDKTISSNYAAQLDSNCSINGDNRYVKVTGGFFDKTGGAIPKSIEILNNEGNVIGYALTLNVIDHLHHDSLNNLNRFTGYILSHAATATLTFCSRYDQACTDVDVSQPFSFGNAEFRPESISADRGDVVASSKWNGRDFQRTSKEGMIVVGSYNGSDANTGEISLMLRRGDSLFFRSGPTAGRQMLMINTGKNTHKYILPMAIDWRVITFRNKSLPDAFMITLSDEGSNWGEWSAIAIRQ